MGAKMATGMNGGYDPREDRAVKRVFTSPYSFPEIQTPAARIPISSEIPEIALAEHIIDHIAAKGTKNALAEVCRMITDHMCEQEPKSAQPTFGTLREVSEIRALISNATARLNELEDSTKARIS